MQYREECLFSEYFFCSRGSFREDRHLKNELERLQAMQEAPGFWDDPEKSQKMVVKAKYVRLEIDVPKSLSSEQKEKLQAFAEACGDKEKPISESWLEKFKNFFK